MPELTNKWQNGRITTVLKLCIIKEWIAVFMNWLSKMERKYGRYAIANLMYYVIILYGLGYVLYKVNPWFYFQYLALDWGAVFRGQVWRILTFLMQPTSDNLLMVVLMLYIYYMIGRQLEAVLGKFRFNFYFITGVLIHILASLVVYLASGGAFVISPGVEYLNLSLFLVFAVLFPNAQFLLFFAIPIQGKWIAIIDSLYFVWAIVRPFLPAYAGIGYGAALSAVASVLNFGLFYLLCKEVQPYSPKEVRRKREFRQKVRQAQRPENRYANGAKHKCAVCGRTELDAPDLEFRYCSKCNGNYEYCQDHLFSHIHVK